MTDPEYRRDPVTGRWAVVAPERSQRPFGLPDAEPRHRTTGEREPCPFCEGQEHDTPHEVLAYRTPGSPADGPGWQLRVVPNRFPAVRAFPPVADAPGSPGLFHAVPAHGRHEVVIETSRHESDPGGMTDAEVAAVFRAYRGRLVSLAADERLAYAAVFKNVGAEAGASLGHTHSQVVATAFVPPAVRAELDGAAAYHAARGRCVFCDVMAADLADGRRVVAETEHFAAVCPFAPRFEYEVWVLPKAHAARYETLTDALAPELGTLVRRLVRALDAAAARPAYNWLLHTAPLRAADGPAFHWHLELFPRLSRVAGFEWGTGCFIVPVAPERAAAELRAALPPPG